MNTISREVDWEEIAKKITEFGVITVPIEECSFGEFVGMGNAMSVYEGTCSIRGDIKKVAFKEHQRFTKKKLRHTEAEVVLGEFRHEITLMNKLKYHPYIVQILGVTFREMRPVLIVELATEPLDFYLEERYDRRKPVSWLEKGRLISNIVVGVKGLHDAGIVHGDLKGENVLIFEDDMGNVEAKISDFGYSSTLSSKQTGVGGTANFMPPENMPLFYPELAIKWSKKPTQDIYSLGLLAYQIVTNGRKPYDGEQIDDVFAAKAADPELSVLLSQIPHDTPTQFRSIIIMAAKHDPQERASLSEISREIQKILSNIDVINSSLSDTVMADGLEKHPRKIRVAETHDSETTSFSTVTTQSSISSTSTSITTQWAKSINYESQILQWQQHVEYTGFNPSKDDINGRLSDGETPLFWAIKKGLPDVIRLLVHEYGADVNAKDPAGYSSIHIAAQYTDKTKMLDILVNECGTNVNSCTNNGWTPIHLAAFHNHAGLLKHLVRELGADPNIRDNSGWTPLHSAVKKESIYAMDVLVRDLHLDVDTKNDKGNTPLHQAARHGSSNVVKHLMNELHADATIKNARDETALDIARRYNMEGTALILEKYGTKSFFGFFRKMNLDMTRSL